MAEIRDNLISLDVVYSKLNATVDKNIELLKEGASAVDAYNKKITSVPSEYKKNLDEIATKNKTLQETQKKLLEIEGQLDTLRKKGNATSKERTQRTSEEIVNQRALAQASDRQAKATSALVGAYANLNAKHQQAKKTLQDLIASQTASSSQIRRAQKEYDALDKRVVAANNAVRQFNYNVGNYPQQALSSIKNLMSAFGVFGGLYLFAGAIKDAFKTIKEFDKANADLAATMGKTRAQISSLTNDQKRLGAITKFTATEVAGLQKEFAKLGFSQNEILNATEATLSLAAAVDTDLANAAMVAGSTLRGFGLEASEMQRVVDVMAKSFTSSALDIENFRESMKYVAPIAKSSGVSIEFTTAMLGKLADAGIKGSQAGTSLRRILAEMAKTGLPAAQALDKVAKSGISVNDAMDEVGRTAQTSLLVLAKSKDGIDDLAKALDNAAGSAKKMADEQLDSLQGKLTLLSSAWDGFILSLEDGSGSGSKAVGFLIDKFTELLNKLTLLEAYSDKKGKIFFDNWKKGVDEFVPKETLDAVEYFNRELQKTESILKSQEQAILKHESNLKKLGDKNFFNSDAVAAEQEKLDEVTKRYNATLQTRDYLENSIKEKSAERLRLESEFITAFTLRNKQVSQAVALSYAQSKTDAQLKRELGLLNISVADNTEKTNKNTKAKKEAEIYQIGTVKWLNQQISELKNLNDTLSTTSEEYQTGVGAIKFYEQWLERLTGTTKKLKEELDGVELDLGGAEFITDAEGDELMRQGNELRALLKEFKQGFIDEFADQSGFSGFLGILQGDLEKFEGDAVATALAVSEAFQQAFNTIAEASQANFDAEYARLESQRDFQIEMAGDSATAREEIERQYEERKRAIQRREAESQKRLALFNIAVNTAQGIISALAMTPPNVPLSIAIGVIGAVQAGLVASKEIPQFWKGTDNAPEGWAWTQEKGAEVITDKSGNVKTLGSEKGAQLTYLSKGDKVYKSHEDYINKVLSKNGIDNLGSYINISQPKEVNNSITKSDLEQNFSKLASVIKNKEGVNISIDERGFRKKQGNIEFINSRLNLTSRQV